MLQVLNALRRLIGGAGCGMRSPQLIDTEERPECDDLNTIRRDPSLRALGSDSATTKEQANWKFLCLTPRSRVS
jgi:hypothetical protein